MMGKLIFFSLVLGLQAFMALSAALDEDESSEESFWTSRINAQVKNYADMYYEDHIKPITDSYVQWATEQASRVWNSISQNLSSYWST